MKRLSILFIICFLSFLYSQPANNITVQNVISFINKSDTEKYIQRLQDFGTRYLFHANRKNIALWLKSEFESMGFTKVELDSFWCKTYAERFPLSYINRTTDTVTIQYNVIATLEGTEKPEDIYIICGHYDNFNEDNKSRMVFIPGADDNASGTAAVMVSAKAVMTSGYKSKSTLKFIAFAAEELMLFGDAGSEHYAAEAKKRNDKIKFVVNNDMIGNNPDYPTNRNIAVIHSTTDIDKIAGSFAGYANLMYVLQKGTGADLEPFTIKGYEGIYFEEYAFSPFYHKSTDLITNINLDYCTEVIKASCAALLTANVITTGIKEQEALPDNFAVRQNYPNPFNPNTTIVYEVPSIRNATAINIKITVYDILGNKITTLLDEEKTPGIYNTAFIADNLPSGIYICRMTAGSYSGSIKMMLVK